MSQKLGSELTDTSLNLSFVIYLVCDLGQVIKLPSASILLALKALDQRAWHIVSPQ